MTGFLRKGDAGYDEARTVWNAMIDRRPAVVARCATTEDVVAAVRFGRTQGLEIAVRCGGHNIAGLAVPEDGLMIDLTPMNAVRVDPATRRAWVEGGAMLGELDKASQEYGLATTAGNVSHTGVGGLTLGGGMGWLARRFGLSCDNVLSFELVTADGSVVRASADENAELYWGLRGGGGNFGVVTMFEFQLHQVGTRALTAEFSYPVSAGLDVLRGWRDLNVEAPRDATFTAFVDGTQVVVGYVWVGEGGYDLVPAFRKLGPVQNELVDETTYLQLQTREDNVQGHRFRRYWKGHYFDVLPDEAISAMLDNPGVPASLQAYGGAIADVPADATAFSRRDTLFEMVTASRWESPAEDEERITRLRGYAATLAPYASGAYVNTLNEDPINRAFPPATLERLIALKTAYDPENVFHLNQNIKPHAA
ncbi:FAD-binding oxidoreductase [Kribbella sp. NPDC048915]|uniref:FAD-binding oxidoreductase n=1 Tax=Kribbella sp. NPDC048915 TaxID=3155148 RepID=UPI00340D9410